jgi:DNA-binding transcriptional regulator LsrR (DeoR family)
MPRGKLSQSGPSFDAEEVASLVWKYFSEGNNINQTAKAIRDNHHLKMTASEVLTALHKAARDKHLRFSTPTSNPLSDKLRKHFRLTSMQIVSTALNQNVAECTAKFLIRLIRNRAKESQEPIRVGLSGGSTVRNIIEQIAPLLEAEANMTPGLPEITFVALVSGFDMYAAGADPTAFFLFLDKPAIKKFTRFVLLHAPSIIHPADRLSLLALPAITLARQEALKLDFILTSAADFDDEHNMLRRCYDAYKVPNMITTLDKPAHKSDQCVGDMMWMPFSSTGPIDYSDHEFCAMTLLDLSDITNAIKDRGARVILAAGPCAAAPECHRLKDRVLKTILTFGLVAPDKKLVTDVITDSRTARQIQLNLKKEQAS